jgi:[ribosomal protein S5]-alanine N-acetyltransferase
MIKAETERLILREVTPEDLDGFYTLDSDQEVHRYLGNHPVSDREKLLEIIHFIRDQYAQHGIGRWAMVEKSTGAFIGWTGLKYVQEPINHPTPYYDLGYRLIQKYWGQGYATESAVASLNYGFDVLQIPEIFAAADVHNAPSNRILTKLGFTKLEPFLYDDALHNWYRLDRAAWKEREDLKRK